MTPSNQEIADRAGQLLGLRGRVYVQERAGLRGRSGGISLRADGLYTGQGPAGGHEVTIRPDMGTVLRVYTIVHECAHAAQAERLGGYRAFRVAYQLAADADGYRENPFEVEARRIGAETTAAIAAELERGGIE